VDQSGILKDSSYTVYGYYQKELIKFPFIKIAKKEIKADVREESNLIYKSIGKRNLKLDLFFPCESKKPIPIVIFIHGGGWRSGDKSFQHPMANEIASNGFLCATIEYRLSPEAKYPAAVQDIKSAIKWLKKNAAIYNADSSKVTLLGCSSGGHLASLCGVTDDIKKFEPDDYLSDISSTVDAVINIDGILDFTHPAESGKDTSELHPSVGKLWLGETYKNNPELWVEASPLTYISKNSPEFLFINSSLDRFHAGRDSAVVLFEKYKINFSIKTLPSTPHTFWLFEPWFNITKDLVVDFLRK
jgi:pectinesterase